jgi:hypothetical protein
MATNPQGAVLSTALTEYAFSLAPDFQGIMAEADFIAPRVVTGAKKGDFSIFDTKQAFLNYDALRSIGGPRRRIKHAGTTGSYNNKPLGLEIGLDDHEVESDSSRPKQEQAKTRTLMSNWANSRFSRAWAAAVTSGNYTATTVTNAGKWSDPNVDPVAKLDDVLVEFANRTGRPPTRAILALDNWVTLRNHPEVIKRQPGAANVGVTLAQLSAMLATPIEARINKTYIGTTGFGSSTDAKAAKVKGYMMLFLAEQAATLEDPSWLKTTSRDNAGFAGVMQYRDNTCNSDIFYLDDEEDVVCASALCATLVTIS